MGYDNPNQNEHEGVTDLVPCKGCGTPVQWAAHVRTGKLAPLVPAPEGVKANIYAAPAPPEWKYRIATKQEMLETEEIKPAYINHFVDCPKAKEFKKK